MAELQTQRPESDAVEAAYRRGHRSGMAVAAFTMGLVTCITLLGLEKAILAGVLGIIALRGLQKGSPGRRLAVWAIVLGALYIVAFIACFIYMMMNYPPSMILHQVFGVEAAQAP